MSAVFDVTDTVEYVAGEVGSAKSPAVEIEDTLSVLALATYDA